MRHATPEGLDQLEPFLARLRELPGLTEKKRGVFYRRSTAFLHFHEDPSGFYADLRLAGDFERFRVETRAEQDALITNVRACLVPPGA